MMRFFYTRLATVAILGAIGIMAWIQYQHVTGGIGGHKAADIPKFTLQDLHGNTVTERSWPGKYLLIYFGYTYCPDVCPTSLTLMNEALAGLGQDSERIVPILITIDPDRDKPDVLTVYTMAFRPNLVGLTGSPNQISVAARQFGAVFARYGNDQDYTMDHSADFYLVGPDGRMAETIPHGIGAAEMAARVGSFLHDRIR